MWCTPQLTSWKVCFTLNFNLLYLLLLSLSCSRQKRYCLTLDIVTQILGYSNHMQQLNNLMLLWHHQFLCKKIVVNSVINLPACHTGYFKKNTQCSQWTGYKITYQDIKLSSEGAVCRCLVICTVNSLPSEICGPLTLGAQGKLPLLPSPLLAVLNP